MLVVMKKTGVPGILVRVFSFTPLLRQVASLYV